MTEEIKTWWNGEPARCERVIVRVGTSEVETHWHHELAGNERPAVAVYYNSDEPFFIDDENGAGWDKVAAGHGGPMHSHRSLPDNSEVVRVVDTNATTQPKYLEAGWIGRAPRRVDFAIESTVVVNEDTGRAYPGVAFAFGGGSDEPVTVVFLASPENMTMLAKHVKNATEEARRGASHARAEMQRRRSAAGREAAKSLGSENESTEVTPA